MYEDERDALAAEYVLGTLSADERDHADALREIDPGFADMIQLWERRLGELNVMVEAVEPPAELWSRIKAGVKTAGVAAVASAPPAATPNPAKPAEPAAIKDAWLRAPPDAPPVAQSRVAPEPPAAAPLSPREAPAARIPSPPAAPTVPTAEAEEADFFDNDPSVTEGGDLDDSAAVAALASSLLPPDEAARFQKPAAPSLRIKPPLPVAGTVRDLDAESANGATRRWRLLTVAFAAIAALLAIYVAVSQFMSGPSAAPFAGSASRGGRLVAVMQQDPTAPAFLVTIDGPARALTVRRVTATPDVGRSYQLWLMPRNGAPVSLGVVGNDEFTTRPIPPNVDNDTLRTANYVISLEQAGGSPTGAMTGPMLFSGHIIEAVPGPQSSN